MKQVTATVVENRVLLPRFERAGGRSMLESRFMWLSCADIAREARPGQFVMVNCGPDCVLPRPFSIHRVRDDNIALFFAVWDEGRGTGWLAGRRAGDTIDLTGPMGNGFSIRPESRNLLLVAGGIGVAPMCFLAGQAAREGYQVRLLTGARTGAQLYPWRALPPGAERFLVTEDGSSGAQGMVTAQIGVHAEWADQVFACGPLAMYRDMHDQLEGALKGKPVQVSLEVCMGCGRGVCYSCTVKTRGGLKQVCQDGPVFDLDELIWDELK